jgi:hypothetical protein
MASPSKGQAPVTGYKQQTSPMLAGTSLPFDLRSLLPAFYVPILVLFLEFFCASTGNYLIDTSLPCHLSTVVAAQIPTEWLQV